LVRLADDDGNGTLEWAEFVKIFRVLAKQQRKEQAQQGKQQKVQALPASGGPTSAGSATKAQGPQTGDEAEAEKMSLRLGPRRATGAAPAAPDYTMDKPDEAAEEKMPLGLGPLQAARLEHLRANRPGPLRANRLGPRRAKGPMPAAEDEETKMRPHLGDRLWDAFAKHANLATAEAETDEKIVSDLRESLRLGPRRATGAAPATTEEEAEGTEEVVEEVEGDEKMSLRLGPRRATAPAAGGTATWADHLRN